MITGVNLIQYLAQKVHQPYTNFLGGTVKANRLFADALLAILQNRYDEVEFQKARDEINFLISTGKVFSLNANQIYQAPLQITSITFQAATATITTYLPHNLITGDTVTMAGVQLNLVPNINTSFVATVTGPKTYTIPYVFASGAYTANTGTVTYSKMITDYWQMDQVAARYDVLYSGVSITGATNSSPITITLDKRTDLRTTSYVAIAGVLGNTNANGNRYLKKLNDFQFSLYADKNRLTPIAGNNAYTSGGTISQIYYKPCKPFLPGTNISPLGTPTPDAPRYKDSERMLKFFPEDTTCPQITIDYFRQPDVVIDVADNVIDLTLYYPQDFLLSGLLNVAARLFGEESRDVLLYEQSQNELRNDN